MIKVEGVSKLYRLGEVGTGSLRHDLNRLWHRLRGKGDPYLKIGETNDRSQKGDSDFAWALQDVDFEVRQGEVLGIIGRNGAGKSTLLKILSRVTTPTRGQVKVKGRIASLLEVGTGFHPELTGRDNIYLNGAILGMRKCEIDRKFDEIVAFAEVERYIDTPVKRYSSGMYVRLAFAVAAHLEPEILIVDEVLAVGDVQFQKKCLGKMQDVSRGGRTILFVSHNMPAVLQLTTSALVLENGRVLYRGGTETAVQKYCEAGAAGSATFFDVDHLRRKHQGNQAARIVSLQFDRPSPLFHPDESFSFQAKVRVDRDVTHIRFSMTIYTVDNVPIGSCFSPEGPGVSAGETVEVKVELQNARLAPGQYYCALAIGKGDHQRGYIDYDVVTDTLAFEVRPGEGEGGTVSTWCRGWGSIVFPELTHETLVKVNGLP